MARTKRTAKTKKSAARQKESTSSKRKSTATRSSPRKKAAKDDSDSEDEPERQEEEVPSSSSDDDEETEMEATIPKAKKSKTAQKVVLGKKTDKKSKKKSKSKSQEEQSVTAASLPSTIMTHAFAAQQDTGKLVKPVLRTFVTHHIVPHLKFIVNNEVMLAYSEKSKSLCQVILEGCHVTARKESWWAAARREVVSVVGSHRTNASNQMQTAFRGKSFIVIGQAHDHL